MCVRLSPQAAESKTRFLFDLRRELQERHEAGVLSALVIDEAQSIPHELLEEIRLLSNRDDDDQAAERDPGRAA